MDKLISLLSQQSFSRVTPFDFKNGEYHIFDLSENNPSLLQIDLNNEAHFSDFIFGTLKEKGVAYGIGKYNEDRVIYKRSTLFEEEESRSLHLGIDIWASAGTPVYAPLDSVVHSFADNDQHGDYGPTIILQHKIDSIEFYTLYGHLSQSSLEGMETGKTFMEGDQIGTLGEYHENVHWPPHLHFQLIRDMEHYQGDFPGVCKPSEKDLWLHKCPNPGLILGL